jgi:hypothetical protein
MLLVANELLSLSDDPPRQEVILPAGCNSGTSRTKGAPLQPGPAQSLRRFRPRLRPKSPQNLWNSVQHHVRDAFAKGIVILLLIVDYRHQLGQP